MKAQDNSINWFEIPATDITRAKKFYETIFAMKMEQNEMMGMKMAFFPAEDMNGKVSGSIVEGPMHKPSTEGSKVYLNGNPDLATVQARIEGAGGKVVMPKTKISDEVGHMAFFIDSEGNNVALHSNN